MRRDGAGAARRCDCDLAVFDTVSGICAGRRARAWRAGEVSGIFECAVQDGVRSRRHDFTFDAPLLSSPAKAGDPVRRGLSSQSLASLEYWVARSSRAMTAEYDGRHTLSFSRRDFA